MVDHDADPGLCTIDEHAAEAVSKAIKRGAEACAQVWCPIVLICTRLGCLLAASPHFGMKLVCSALHTAPACAALMSQSPNLLGLSWASRIHVVFSVTQKRCDDEEDGY